jgi:hypothetical protein
MIKESIAKLVKKENLTGLMLKILQLQQGKLMSMRKKNLSKGD